jgi:hypothetical protein
MTPTNLNMITALDISMSAQQHWRKNTQNERTGLEASLPNFDIEEFDKTLAVLASMSLFRRLYVLLIIITFPPLTDAVLDAVLKPIDRMRGKTLEFHLAAPEPAFRVFRQHQDPPYTSISFGNIGDTGPDIYNEGFKGEKWDDGEFERGKDDGNWFPIYTCKHELNTDRDSILFNTLQQRQLKSPGTTQSRLRLGVCAL